MKGGTDCFEDLSMAAHRRGFMVRRRVFTQGERLLDQGDEPCGVFLLHSGLARVYTTATNGQQILFGFVGPGQILGEVEYFAKELYACSVEAKQRTDTSFLATEVLDALIHSEPALGLGLARTLARRYYNGIQRTSSRITHPLAYNVLQLCLSLMAGPQRSKTRLPKCDLAEYLATSERHLNRVLKNLAERGVLKIAPGEVLGIDAGRAQAFMNASR